MRFYLDLEIHCLSKPLVFLGIEAMNAYYIGAKIGDLFFAVANGFSDSISSIIGISLGQGKLKEAGQQSMYLISMAIGLCLGAVILITWFSPFLVSLFEVQSTSVLNNAIWIVRIFALRIGMRFFYRNYFWYVAYRRRYQSLDVSGQWLDVYGGTFYRFWQYFGISCSKYCSCISIMSNRVCIAHFIWNDAVSKRSLEDKFSQLKKKQ